MAFPTKDDSTVPPKADKGARPTGVRSQGPSEPASVPAATTAAPRPAPEFSRRFEVAKFGEEDDRLTITATPEECAALARRFGVGVVEALEAEAFVRTIAGDGVRARVTFHAAVVQSSVVTLDPVQSRVDEVFDVEFLPQAAASGAADRGDKEDLTDVGIGGEAIGLDAPEPPGEVIDGWFDLGDMIAEYLSLAIDPYPRQVGEEFGEWRDAAEDGGEKKAGPFAGLKHWRSRA